MVLMTNYFIMLISILMSTAFITLLERKLLSYLQVRKGPNKVGHYGMLQPFSDAMKLLHKQNSPPTNSNHILYILSPMITLILTMSLINSMSFAEPTTYDQNFNMITFMLLSSLLIYPIITIGWAPNSKFSALGTFRNMAQIISYEISMFLIMLTPLMIYSSYNSTKFITENNTMKTLLLIMPILIMWIITTLSETNRTPFDFAEGESELVSGFNVEFMSTPFTMIFLAEYSAISIMAMVSSLMFLPSKMNTPMMAMMLAITILIMRGTLPRHRFDMMMSLNWKIMLPLAIMPPAMMLCMNNTM